MIVITFYNSDELNLINVQKFSLKFFWRVINEKSFSKQYFFFFHLIILIIETFFFFDYNIHKISYILNLIYYFKLIYNKNGVVINNL